MDNVLRKSASIANNRIFKQDIRRSYSRHINNLQDISKRRINKASLYSASRMSFFKQSQEKRISNSNRQIARKLSAVTGIVGSIRKNNPPIVNHNIYRQRLKKQVLKQNQILASKLITVCNRDHRNKISKQIQQYLIRRKNIRKCWGQGEF